MFYRKKISNIADKEKERLILYFPILSSSHGEKKKPKMEQKRQILVTQCRPDIGYHVQYIG